MITTRKVIGIVMSILLGVIFFMPVKADAQTGKKENVPVEAKDVMNDFMSRKSVATTNGTNNMTKSGIAANFTKSTWFKRGSWLMWSKDHFTWKVRDRKIVSSSGWQESGYVFPNIVKKKGTTRYSKSNTLHKWRGRKIMGAGVVTPWGAVQVYNSDVTDYYGLTNTGRAHWY